MKQVWAGLGAVGGRELRVFAFGDGVASGRRDGGALWFEWFEIHYL
jgi:hypothetical protein